MVKYLFVSDADGCASDGDDFHLIQPVVVLKPEKFCFGNSEMECFSVNAGKPDLKLSAFFMCSYTLDSGSPCYQHFNSQERLDLHMHHLTLERDAADLVIPSQLCSSLRCGDMTQNTKRRVNTGRKKVRSQYTHQGKNICRELFRFIHGVDNLIKHYHLHGLIPRQHGNKNRLPKHSLSFQEMEMVVSFVTNYAEEHGILLPKEYRTTRQMTSSSCHRHAPRHQCVHVMLQCVLLMAVDAWPSARS